MFEGQTDVAEYKKIIFDTYIVPIRSVIAVDDEFPSLDTIFGNPSETEDSLGRYAWRGDEVHAERLRDLLRECRGRRWICDVHDGKNIQLGSDGTLDIEHIHQTDLLVLDFELSKSGEGSEKWEKALAIISGLSKNPRFNIVIVYTKEDSSIVFREVRKRLMNPTKELLGNNHNTVAEYIDHWHANNAEELKPLLNLQNAALYMEYRRKQFNSDRPLSNSEVKSIDGVSKDDLKLISKLITGTGKARGENKRIAAVDVIKWLLFEFQNTLQLDDLNQDVQRKLTWLEMTATSDVNWIRSDRIFVTVIKKDDKDDINLVNKLQEALCSWDPTPYRIILSKLRSEIESCGGIAEETALTHHLTQAGWLERVMRDVSEEQRMVKLQTMLSRQWSSLQQLINRTSLDHATEVIHVEQARFGSPVESINKRYDLDLSGKDQKSKKDQQAVGLHLNCYECSKPVQGTTLTTGHILSFGKHLWVCVTPACDLVPDQGLEDTWRAELGTDLMPVKLLRLFEKHDVTDSLASATTGQYLFLKHIYGFGAYGIVPSGDNERYPLWEQMFVLNKGQFDQNNLTLSILRVQNVVPKAGGRDTAGELEIPLHLDKVSDVKIVSQLRYEYALNVLQRVGASMTRVGLDFIKYPN